MRYPDWQTRFWKAMELQRRQPFEYGKRDCVLFAATIADAISMDGHYVVRAREDFSWSNTKEATLLLRDARLADLVESVLGQPTSWVKLSMGDIVLIVDDNDRECLTIHDGAQLVGPGDGAFIIIPFRCARGGWRIA